MQNMRGRESKKQTSPAADKAQKAVRRACAQGGRLAMVAGQDFGGVGIHGSLTTLRGPKAGDEVPTYLATGPSP